MTTAVSRRRALGLVYPVRTGLQFNVTAAWRKDPKTADWLESEVCDHACRRKHPKTGRRTGHYDCDASFFVNEGVRRSSMAPAEDIIRVTKLALEGQLNAHRRAIDSQAFDALMAKFRIPAAEAAEMRAEYTSAKQEVNWFGGDSEMHPEIDRLLAWTFDQGISTSFTTTGARIAFAKDGPGKESHHIFEALRSTPPTVLAMSLDSIRNMADLESLLNSTNRQLLRRRNATSVAFGQRRKTIEAMAATNRILELGFNTKPYFNCAFGPKLAPYIPEIAERIREKWPTATLNPYLAQSSFGFGKPTWKPKDLGNLHQTIRWCLLQHKLGKNIIPARLQHWALLEAGYRLLEDNPIELSRRMSGYGMWTCFENALANSYLQIGQSIRRVPALVQIGSDPIAAPEPWKHGNLAGLTASCYWKPDGVAAKTQVSSVSQIERHVEGGMAEIAASLLEESRCPGCIMGRLLFDLVTTLAGVVDDLVAPMTEVLTEYAWWQQAA